MIRGRLWDRAYEKEGFANRAKCAVSDDDRREIVAGKTCPDLVEGDRIACSVISRFLTHNS
jgi:hypothetical protein